MGQVVALRFRPLNVLGERKDIAPRVWHGAQKTRVLDFPMEVVGTTLLSTRPTSKESYAV